VRADGDVKAISLFSGAGGFEQGFDRAGIETQLMVEIDEKAQAVLRRHYPETELIADVRDVQQDSSSAQGDRRHLEGTNNSTDLERIRSGVASEGSDIDLVYGGFPCQDVSVAGHRKGLAGERSGLWFEFHRIVSQLQPRWVVIENVRGLLSSNKGRDFEVILEGLDELGYGVSWAVLDAQHVGVPQRRAKVFIVASLGNESSREVLALCESCGGHFEAVETPQQEVAGTLGGRTKGAGGFRQDLDNNGAYIPVVIQDTVHMTKDQNGVGAMEADTMYTLDGQSRPGVYIPVVASPLPLIHDFTQPVAPPVNARDWKGPSTFRNGSLQSTALIGVRRLTVTECERLMGWPDGWTEYGIGEDDERINMADTHRFRLIGNGVASPVAQWLGHRLVEVDSWA